LLVKAIGSSGLDVSGTHCSFHLIVASMDFDFSVGLPVAGLGLWQLIPPTTTPWMIFPLGPGLLYTKEGSPGQSPLLVMHLPVPMGV
jgi:hypothetical protein